MPLPTTVAAQRLAENKATALGLVDRYRALDAHLAGLADQAAQATAAAAFALAQAYLPELSPAAIARAERLSGFQGFRRRDPIKAMEREAHVLRQAIARVQADPRYVRREYLVGPVGELTRKREETTSLLEPWEQECAAFEGQEGFGELLTHGYDTPAFTVPFWEPIYWRLWAAGDRICAALGMDDFGDDVLPAWRKVEAERARWRRELALVDGRIDEVHELVREHDQAQARLPELSRIFLEGSHQVLAEHLRHADPQLLSTWLSDQDEEQRPMLLALRRLAGAAAKEGFLQELRRHGVQAQIQDLAARAAKYDRKAQKYARPKLRGLTVPDEIADPGFAERARAGHARADKLERLAQGLMAFHDYDRFDLSNDPELWWLHMTGKAPPAMTPSLRRWYEQHRDARPVLLHTDTDPAVATSVAVAAAVHAQDAHDFLS